MFTIAIIGRPNVGKSTLFNKLAGQSLAIVNDFAGVTRDRKESIGYLGPLEFKIIDTPGWNNNPDKNALEYRMLEQTENGIAEADICILVVDKAGITALDKIFADKLRIVGKPTILVVNKCDDLKNIDNFDKEFYRLGFKEIVGISAEHKNGFNILYDAIEPYYDKYQAIEKKINIDDENDEKPIHLTIVGRPNAGKSTLINQLLGEERLVTGPEAGITRDSIAVNWEYKGKKIKLIDTAGIRKKRNIDKELEKMSVTEAMKSIKFAQVVIMMLDANSPLDAQDLAIASILAEEGRGVVFALNKWDIIENKHNIMNETIKIVESSLPNLKGCPIVPISALNGKNIDKLMQAVFDVFKAWDSHIVTAKLNQWLRVIEKEHTPPLYKGNQVKLKYITQAKKRPPTFVLFTNSPERLEQTSYNRFIINRLRIDFNLNNTIVRLLLRKAKNPYSNTEERKKNNKKKR